MIKRGLIMLLALLLFINWFNRHPYISNDIKKTSSNIVLSPSYGTIKKIVNDGTKTHIMIFLSPLDVHVQYYPMSGQIISQVYDNTGRFELAYNLNKSKFNEKVITTLKTPYLDDNIIIYQIAGFFVRRIDNDTYQDNSVIVGDKLGMIRFGSRVDLILPSNGLILNVKENDYVNGVYTKIAEYKN